MRHPIKFLSYYITNVCPKTCKECSTFNNYKFKNHLKWENNKDAATKWHELLDVEEFSIMGGEPLLHPQVEDWALGLKEIWKDHKDFRLVTGVSKDTLLAKASTIKKLLKAGIILEISVHDSREKNEIIDVVENVILKEYFEEINIKNECQMINNNWPQDQLFFSYQGQNIVIMNFSWIFAESAINRIENKIIYFHDSDQEQAHATCAWKECHYLVEGILYKCLVAGVGQQLKEQFAIDPASKEILDRTVGLDPWADQNVIDEFLKNLPNSIEQCKLCPANHQEMLVHIAPAEKTKSDLL